MKRAREDDAISDEIMGIELTDGGKVWYFHRSTLVNAGGYFAARFGGDIPAGGGRQDEHGRSVYFVERDGELFGNHIRHYILSNHAGKLPPFSQDPELWRLLRLEADFFALDGLSTMLYATKVCNQNDPLGRGILHYLGTNKGREEYQNPQAREVVAVGGWPEMSEQEQHERGWRGFGIVPQGMRSSSLQVLVEYRPPVVGENRGNTIFESRDRCALLPCCFSCYRIPVTIELKGSVSVFPKAYSLRYGTCYGACNWNFEASENGVEWTVLHEARNDTHLFRSNEDEEEEQRTFHGWSADELLLHAERNLRHTWNIELESPRFFKFFRIIGMGTEDLDEEKVCMHVVGLELFGDIHEE